MSECDTCADYAYIHVGQAYENGIGAIARAADNRKKVILVGAYLSMGTEKMHMRFMKTFPMKAMSMPGLKNPLEGLDVIATAKGLLPDNRVAQWIVDVAKREALSNK